MLKIRCSMLHLIMSEPRNKLARDNNELSESAKSYLIDLYKKNTTGFDSFKGNKYTEKGNLCEDESIVNSSVLDNEFYFKNTEYRENKWICGTCDIDSNKIIDIKNSWDIGTHPLFRSEAEKKTKNDGYFWQMIGYMWLWHRKQAEIHYWLNPTPPDLLSRYDDEFDHIDRVLMMTLEERRTVDYVDFSWKYVAEIKRKVIACRKFYAELEAERNIKEVA